MITRAIYEKYREDKTLVTKFFEFTATVFPRADFTTWHNRGHWQADYIPISVMDKDRIVANVSVSRMKLLIDGRHCSGIQFGTVGTIPEYRNQGLARFLMEYALDTYAEGTDLSFLFANESVLDFYPMFGFRRVHETDFISPGNVSRSASGIRKLSLDFDPDCRLITSLLSRRIPLTSLFGATDHGFITWWHLLNIFSDNLFYMENADLLIIVSEDTDHIHLYDIVSDKPVNLASTLSKILPPGESKPVKFYFPPDTFPFDCGPAMPSDDTLLFVLGDFPIADRQFKFPTTGQT